MFGYTLLNSLTGKIFYVSFSWSMKHKFWLEPSECERMSSTWAPRTVYRKFFAVTVLYEGKLGNHDTYQFHWSIHTHCVVDENQADSNKRRFADCDYGKCVDRYLCSHCWDIGLE